MELYEGSKDEPLNRKTILPQLKTVFQPVLGGYKLSCLPDGHDIKRTYMKPKESGQLVLFRKPSRQRSVFSLYTMVCIMGMRSVMLAGDKGMCIGKNCHI